MNGQRRERVRAGRMKRSLTGELGEIQGNWYPKHLFPYKRAQCLDLAWLGSAGWLAGWLADWLAGGLAGGLPGWLVGNTCLF